MTITIDLENNERAIIIEALSKLFNSLLDCYFEIDEDSERDLHLNKLMDIQQTLKRIRYAIDSRAV